MPSTRGLFSPPGHSAVSRVPSSPENYISPSTRRKSSNTINTVSTLLNTPSVNDDIAERKERRRSKLLDLQRRTLNSPATPSNESRRRSLPLNGLSNAQVSEIYSNCIKLSAENKINAKNAFGLHLIDYMSELLKKKDLNNFQVASSTLDASAKIYAGRVDAIHSETYKVLSGLGRGSDKQENKENIEGLQEDANVEGDKETKRKRARKSNTIETNLKNINVNKFDLEFEVDPLFSKTSATFDEGGTGGLLLNHLRCLDDTSELVLDSNTIMCTNVEQAPLTSSQNKRNLVNLTDFKASYASLKDENLYICPAFKDFEFMNWNRMDDESQVSFVEKMMGSGDAGVKNEHAFDLDAEVEPIPGCSQSTEAVSEAEDRRGFIDDFDNIQDDDDYTEADRSERDYCLGDGKEAQIATTTIQNMKHGTIGNLMQVLAAEPSDYSYFNTNLLRTWAGPEHWKLRPKSKDIKNETESSDKSRKAKDKKAALVLNYSEEVDFDALFKKSRAATTLTKSTLDKYTKSRNTLPEDLHYDADKLLKIFIKPKIMVKRHAQSKNMDDGVENYDYDNENDRENFCPDLEDDDNDEGFNFTAGSNEPFTQNLTTQGSFVDNDPASDGTLLTGDKLVEQPRKIAKIDINYAKTAKRMDMKRLKSSMWGLLVVPEKKEEEVVANKEDTAEPSTAVAGMHSFQNLVKELPSKISKSMSNNLSVPMAFVCLLHLANEKTLQITCDDLMSDLQISQG